MGDGYGVLVGVAAGISLFGLSIRVTGVVERIWHWARA